MATVVGKPITNELKKYGAFDVSQCYQCGTCTAVCPLTEVDGEFPRKVIRHAQLGMKNRVLGGEHLWRCYYCGECTTTCPRDADPAGFMMAARRYAITRFDVTGISRLLYSKVWSPIVVGLLTLASLVFFYSISNDIPSNESEYRLFDYIDFHVVHDYGMALGGVVGLFAIIGVVNMIRLTLGNYKNRDPEDAPKSGFLMRWIKALIYVAIVEVGFQKSYKGECESEPRPWYQNRWFIHMCMFWGFIYLLMATTLDFMLKTPDENNELVTLDSNLLHIVYRGIGTLGAIFLMLGASLAILMRFTDKESPYTKVTDVGDWLFLWLLFLTGLTGSVLTLALYFPPADWGYHMFVFHLVFAIDLLLLAPFTKFSHAVYRPIALWIHRAMRADQ